MDSARKALAQGRYEDMNWALLKGTGCTSGPERTSTRRGLAELINLVRLFPLVGLRVDDLPPEAKTLLDLPMAEPVGIRHLSETIGAVHGVAKKGITAHLASVREKAERSPADSSLSLSLLAVAERSLAEEKLEQAVELVRDADRAVGASMAEVQEMRALSHRYHELAAIADELGLDAGHHRDLYRQALRSRDVPTDGPSAQGGGDRGGKGDRRLPTPHGGPFLGAVQPRLVPGPPYHDRRGHAPDDPVAAGQGPAAG